MGNMQVRGSSAGDKVGNFFANMLDADSHFLEGSLKILTIPETLLSGHVPDFKAIGNAYKNYGLETANSFTDGHRYDSGAAPLSQAQQMANAILASRERFEDPNNILTKQYTNFSKSVSNFTRNPSTGATQNAPPSAVAKIANPNVKMSYASSRGAGRDAMDASFAVNDSANSHSLALGPTSNNQAGGGGTVPNAGLKTNQFTPSVSSATQSSSGSGNYSLPT